MSQALAGKVALAAGATRGAGRGIAVELGAAGATVYCTGRSTRGNPSDLNRPETIEETAELVTAAGGEGIALQVDHTVESEVKALFEHVNAEQEGQLDILINDIWGGEKMIEWGKKFWELEPSQSLKLIERAMFTHIITARYGVPLMVKNGSGLVIEITDGDTLDYRGHFVYDFVKTGVIRMALGMAKDLQDTGVTALALTPGFLRSEEMLDHFGVSEENWRDAAQQEPSFIVSETPHYIGRAVAALAADPNINEKSGQALATWHLMKEYGFTDLNGTKPDWGKHFEEHIASQQS